MSRKWLNLFLRFSGYIFLLKKKIVESKSLVRVLPYVFLLLGTELVFLIISLPLYLIVSPKKLQESGFIFPTEEKEPEHFHVYIVRRRISLATVFGAGGIFLLKLVFVGLVSTYLLGAQTLLAAAQNWDFNTPVEYTYDSAKIEMTGGVAQLKDQGTGGNCSGTATACDTFVSSPVCGAQGGCAWGGGASGATTNPDFTSNSTGWTGADWSWTPTTETRIATGGNPTGYIQISAPKARNILGGGYWYQAFTTTIANPTATVSFDWKNIAYQAGATVTAYVFVDTAPGVPTIGTQVWTQTITGATAWASVANIDIASRVATAGTYYLKVAYYANNGNGNTGPYTIGFDNVQLNWSKVASCSGAPTACNTYVASSACSAQGGCSWISAPVYPATSPSIQPVNSFAPTGVTAWNSFTETAVKNGGEINYQLSSDDGATWKYWNGSVWAVATTAVNSNTASVINTNINVFSAEAGRIIWKAFLASNGAQQVILDNIAVGYTQNAVPNIQNLSASQSVSSGYVNINYSLQDNNNDPINLPNYEYSLTGIFAGEQMAMTPVLSDPAHGGIVDLSSSPAGVAHTFVWNAQADLGNIYSDTVYIRLRANDGIANSNYAISSAISVDYVNPIISNTTAVQVAGNSNIQINYDLSDDTVNDILVELQVSSDGGLTWTVPVASTSGDIGSSVSSGNNKSIIWEAGADYANQEQNNMVARIRAKDKFQNQGSYINSASFVLDNRAPVIATAVDLLAQPLAGATNVLIGGSFAEGNPDTNNFYVAINGSAYGSAIPGDADTATPSDKNIPVGTALDGNDYISAVKIEHTDDFGHVAVNENISPNSIYQYVKPYTPPAPTISNPGENSLDVIINKNPLETDGLEYAVFENIQNQYLQGDGTFSSNPYWQAVGVISATGLSQPISQYNFKVKSRNTSDASYAISSESDFGSGASSDYQSPNITINSTAQTTNGTKYVVINYTGTDHQNQVNNLVKYEYSLNGADWQLMTEKSGVGSAGTTGLAFTNSGANLVFAWDVGADLPGVEDSAVYARLESNDTITNSNLAVSPAFIVNTAGPVVSNIQVAQITGADNILITYDLADSAGANNVVVLSISDDGGATYSVSAPSVSGDIGNGITAGLTRGIVWNAEADFPNQEKNSMKIKIVATDSYGNEGDPAESGDFSTDTKAPVINNITAEQSLGSALVAVNYDLADLSPANVSFEVSSDGGVNWDIATTTYTGDMGAGQIAGAKLFNWNAVVDFPDQELATMRVRVRAVDNFGHQSAYESSTNFSVNTKVLSISNITAEQNIGARTIAVHYNLNKTATINLDISSDGGITWDIATTTLTGQIGSGIAVGNNKTISWNAGADFNNEEKSSMRVRLRGLDAFGILSPYYESADFSVDTAAPLGLLSLNKFSGTDTSATMSWSAGIVDAHFSHYELWHGASQNDVVNRAGEALKWSIADDANLSAITTISTVITGINLTGDYYAKIWAIDNYGNEATVAYLNIFNPPVQKILTMNASAGGTTNPAPGAHNYNVDSLINIMGISDSGYNFSRWEEGGIAFSTASSTDILLNNDRTISAIFEALTETPAPAPPVIISSGGGSAPRLDTTPPEKPILSSLASPTNITTINISGLAEAGSLVDLYDNGILIRRLDRIADGNGRFDQIINFSEGEHKLTTKAVDSSANESEASDSVDLKIKTTPPNAPIVLSPKGGDRITEDAPVLIGVAEPLSRLEIILDGKNKFTTTVDIDGAWRFKLPTDFSLKDGAHSFALIAIDQVGNKSAETLLNLDKIVLPIKINEEKVVDIPPAQPAIIPAAGPSAVPAVELISTPLPPAQLIRDNTEAIELAGVPIPTVAGATATAANDVFTFTGTALPNQDVIVYVHSDQALIYRTKTDANGIWRINHSQAEVELAPGEHTIFAVAVDPNAKVKSQPSLVSTFTVSKSFWVSVFDRLNLQTTVITLVVVLLSMLWLYQIRKREVVA